MPTPHEFLETLAIVLGVAAFATVIFQRLRQPVVLGYIIAGLIVGPHLPLPLNAHPQTVNVLSELGVILLMFAIGLELTIEKLVRVAPTAGVIGIIQVAFMIGTGFAIGRMFGWTPQESMFIGAAISISSTTIIAKAFADANVSSKLRDIVYGVLIVEDIIAILLLATMTTVSTGAGLTAMSLAATTGKLVAFLVGMVVIGLLVVPRLMRWVVGLGRAETTLVVSIGVCFLLATACAAFHYSVALGAFVAGVLISESGKGHDVEHLLMPVRDMFAAIFFVSVGMLIDPALVIENWIAVLVLSAVVVIGKIASVGFGSVVTGCGLRASVQTGMSLAQIGEFSFIIAGLGLQLGVVRPFVFPVAVAVSALTTLTTPTLIQRSESVAASVETRLPRNVTALIALYSAWVERMRTAERSSSTGARLRRLVILLLVDVAVVDALLLGASLYHHRAEAALGARFGLTPEKTQLVFAAAAALVVLPFVAGVVRLSRAIGLLLVNPSDIGRAPGGAARTIALVVQLGLLTAFGISSIVIVEPFVPAGLEIILAAALFTTLAIAFWRNAKRFDTEVNAGAAAVMGVIQRKLRASAKDDHHLSAEEMVATETAVAKDFATLLPGLGAPVLVPLDERSAARGKTLGELDLRSQTGAAVLGIVRAGQSTLMPDNAERIDAGDVVAIVGSEEAVAKATLLLSRAPS